MEEDDHDELLQCTDDESLSESEDQCLPVDKYEDVPKVQQQYATHSLLEFLIVKTLLVASSTFLIVLLPLYVEAINVKSDVYSILYLLPLFATIILLVGYYLFKLLCPKCVAYDLLKVPLKCADLFRLSVLCTVSGFMIVYALDRKRVMCHLQDPIKGIVLVFALIYYFFFCKKRKLGSFVQIVVLNLDFGLQ